MHSMEVGSSATRPAPPASRDFAASGWESNLLVRLLSSRGVLICMVMLVTIVPIVWNYNDSGQRSAAMDEDALAWNITQSAQDVYAKNGKEVPQQPETRAHMDETINAELNVTTTTRARARTRASMLDILRASEGAAAVLAFGDSLTHGLMRLQDSAGSVELFPYAWPLSHLINNRTDSGSGSSSSSSGSSSSNSQVNVIESGESGELTSHMATRLPALLRDSPQTRVAVILGGTNDLGHHRPPREIVRSILKLHKIALDFQSPPTASPLMKMHTVLVTIPQVRWPIRQQDRLVANDLLRTFARQCSQRVALVDIEAAWDQAIPENAKFWSTDFVHLSKAGYTDLARRIYESMRSFQAKEEEEEEEDEHTTPCASEAYKEA